MFPRVHGVAVRYRVAVAYRLGGDYDVIGRDARDVDGLRVVGEQRERHVRKPAGVVRPVVERDRSEFLSRRLVGNGELYLIGQSVIPQRLFEIVAVDVCGEFAVRHLIGHFGVFQLAARHEGNGGRIGVGVARTRGYATRHIVRLGQLCGSERRGGGIGGVCVLLEFESTRYRLSGSAGDHARHARDVRELFSVIVVLADCNRISYFYIKSYDLLAVNIVILLEYGF